MKVNQAAQLKGSRCNDGGCFREVVRDKRPEKPHSFVCHTVSILESADHPPPPPSTGSHFFLCIMFNQTHLAKLVLPVAWQHGPWKPFYFKRIKLITKAVISTHELKKHTKEQTPGWVRAFPPTSAMAVPWLALRRGTAHLWVASPLNHCTSHSRGCICTI